MAKKKKTWTAEEVLKTKAGKKPENKKVLESLPPAEKKKSKYGNRKVVVDGMTFDSKKEADHYWQYQILLSKGDIIKYRRQVRFKLVDDVETGFTLTYVADHVITHPSGKIEVVDSKGFRTSVFNRKWKLMAKKYPDYILTVR